MLPPTARPNDLVEVVKENNNYFGMFGTLVYVYKNTATVEFYGKQVKLPISNLKLKARVGTVRHAEICQRLEEQVPKHLNKEDYNDLVNLALMLGENEWAKELLDRSNGK